MTIVAVQAAIRMKLSNNRIKPILAAEWRASIELQRICRGKFGRLKAHRAKYHIACVHIQAVWRGAVARARSDKLWLNKIVVPIQTMVRGYLARINTGDDRAELDKCASIIQCKFRSFLAIRKVTRMLNIRENEYRMDNIAQLTAEEEYVQERIEKMIRRLLRKDFQGRFTLPLCLSLSLPLSLSVSVSHCAECDRVTSANSSHHLLLPLTLLSVSYTMYVQVKLHRNLKRCWIPYKRSMTPRTTSSR